MGVTGSVILNGKEVKIPKDFFDVGVKASFNEEIQANLTTEQFTFILDGYELIKEWINDGNSGGVGIFEGIPTAITAGTNTNNVTIFKGILDLQDNAIINDVKREISVSLRQDDNLNQLDQLIESLDFGYLKSIGEITQSDYVDVDYVVNPNDKGIETITTFITIYLLSKQVSDSIKDIGETAAITSGIAVSGVSGPVGAAVYAVAVAIIQIAYAAALLILLINFGSDLLNIVVQPTRTHKAILFKTLLEKTCNYVGYNFETSVEDLNNLVYLPSNQNVDEFGPKSIITKVASITDGIPNISDPGYTCTELFQFAKQLFNARFAIVGNTVQFHTESADYWLSQSGWEKPEAKRNVDEQSSYRNNTDELKSSIFIQFQRDITDEYTIKNYKGTAFQVLTDAKATNNLANKTIKGLDRVDLPFSLGNRKESLTFFERSLLPLANLFDVVGAIFGGRPNLSKKIKNKVGVLQVSNNNHAIPKLLWLQGGRIPSNQRDLFSAKTLWDKYHNEKSFVQNNFARQRRYYENQEIPFGLNDFVTLLNNSYFRDENGVIGKVTDLEWRFNKDTAIISYWIQNTYTNNLKETFIEPE